jgi:hypothetical protein
MAEGPLVNVDRFQHRPHGAVTALLPDPVRVDEAVDALRAIGVDISDVEILHGPEGVRIFDRTGREHGLRSQLIRWFQSLGYDENILAVLDEGLHKGEVLLTVPCQPSARYNIGSELVALGAHAVLYATGTTVETLTKP